MNIDHSTVLVTGANRGLGAAFCRTLQERGASKINAAARRPEQVDTPGVVPVQLDITSAADIDAAVERCGDVTLLINNAGIGTGTGVFADDALDQLLADDVSRRVKAALSGDLSLLYAMIAS